MVANKETISVRCACGKRLTAPATSAGRKARCPSCGGVLVLTPAEAVAGPPPMPVGATVARTAAPARAPVPAARRAPVSVQTPAPAPDDGLGALYELAEQAESAAPPKESARCPQCRAAMGDGVVVCLGCGYNARTGKTLGAAVLAKPGKPASRSAKGNFGKNPVDMMAPQGSFMLGLVLSAAFAVGASLVWILVAAITGFTIGYIAVLIGFAAGIGMQIGHKGYSTVGGTAASGITLAAILLAKLAVLELVLGPGRSINDVDSAKLGFYFFSPIGLIIMAVGMGAAFRTANGKGK